MVIVRNDVCKNRTVKKKKRETEIQARIEFLILRESVINNFAMK